MRKVESMTAALVICAVPLLAAVGLGGYLQVRVLHVTVVGAAIAAPFVAGVWVDWMRLPVVWRFAMVPLTPLVIVLGGKVLGLAGGSRHELAMEFFTGCLGGAAVAGAARGFGWQLRHGGRKGTPEA